MRKVYMKEVGIKKRNPIARVLQFFTSKRFKDKTKYTRKIKHGKKTKIWD